MLTEQSFNYTKVKLADRQLPITTANDPPPPPPGDHCLFIYMVYRLNTVHRTLKVRYKYINIKLQGENL